MASNDIPAPPAPPAPPGQGQTKPFSFESIPARVFEYRSGVVTLLHEACPVTVVFDGTHLRIYAQGQALLALRPGTQCFQDNRNFMFPADNGVWLSILLPDEAPQPAIAAFITAVSSVCVILDGRPEGDWSSQAVEGIQAATAAIAATIAASASHASKAIGWGSTKLRSYINRDAQPMQISPAVRTSAAAVCTVARTASSAVTTVVAGAAAVGSRLIPRSDSMSSSPVARVAVEGVRSAAALWGQIADAVNTVSGTALRETTLTIRHKYGDDAASVAESAAGTVAAMRNIATSVRPSSVVKQSVSHAISQRQ